MKHLSRAFKIWIIGLVWMPTVSLATEYRNGIAEIARMYDALYARYGQGGVEMRDAMARSECGEIYTANQQGRSCVACREQVMDQCAPARLWKTVIIGEESRQYLTEEQANNFGNSIGSVECRDSRDPNRWYISTGYLVASNVIIITAHGLYGRERGRDGRLRRVKVFDPIMSCQFVLRDWATGKLSVHRFKQVAECPDFSDIVGIGNCDWAIVQLNSSAPKEVKPLELAIVSAEALVGQGVIAVGHHRGVIINGLEVNPADKLIDVTGVVKGKRSGTRLHAYKNLIPFTADTNPFSSGQPLIAKINGRYVVVASNSGEFDIDNKKKGQWDDERFFNYAELINPQMIEQIKQFAPPAEKSRFDTVLRLNSFSRHTEI